MRHGRWTIYPTGDRLSGQQQGVGLSQGSSGIAGETHIKGTADWKSGKQIALFAGAVGLVVLSLLLIAPGRLNNLWQLVAAIRSLLRAGYLVLSVSLVSGALVATFLWWRRKGLEGLRQGLFVLSLGLAFAGEMFLLDQAFVAGAVFYLAGGVVLIAQLRLGDDGAGQALEWTAWPWKKEAAAFIVVLASAILTHFYLLGRVPYGIEGDESSWALRVVEAMNQGGAGLSYPFAQMPTSFWMQSLSYRLFGTSIESARLGVALLSLAGTVLFYFAAREMVNIPVALLATYLLGISLIDIAASRQAHVETYVKIWIMGAVACMLWGYRRHKRLLFVLAGASLAMGLMVYDSFALTPFALFAYAAWQLIRDRQNWREHLAYLIAMLVPVAAVAPGVWAYLEGRRISQVATLTTETGVFLNSTDQITALLPHLTGFVAKYAGVTLERLTVQQLNDVLIGRLGPLESAAFVPVLFLGFILAARFWRKRHISFALFWVLVPGLPTSLLLGQTFARTYYPFLGGLVILAAVALWVPFNSLRQGLSGNGRIGLMAALVTFLAALGLSNTFVYFNEVWDPAERQVRREFGELLSRQLLPGQIVYLPYMPLQNDFFETEWRYAHYIASGLFPRSNLSQLYQSVPYQQLLQTISNNGVPSGGVSIFYDKTISGPAERESVLRALKRCYPGYSVQMGRYLDVFSASSKALSQPACSSTIDLRLTSPASRETIAATHGVNFSWQMSPGKTTAYRLVVEKRNDQVIWLEAEDFRGRGWEAQNHLAGQYTGSAYLADVEGPNNVAQKMVNISQTDKYNIWVRTLRRRADGSPVFLQIGGAKLEIGSAETDDWEWQSLGWYEVPSGEQQIAITREYGENPPWQIFIDAIVLSRQASFDPNSEREWEQVLDTATVSSVQNHFQYKLPLADGDYRWRVEVFDGDRIIGWDGTPGYTSANSVFRIDHTVTDAK